MRIVGRVSRGCACCMKSVVACTVSLFGRLLAIASRPREWANWILLVMALVLGYDGFCA